MLEGKKVLLGVTGGIACYKSAYLVRLLRSAGAEVRVVLSKGAQAFVQPLTFQSLSGNAVSVDILSPEEESAISHIELARWADMVLIAPATAHFLAKLSCGLADDLLSTLCLATTAPIIVVPAMNKVMWLNSATQANVSTLTSRGIDLIGPAEGGQACGEEGVGRMEEPDQIVRHASTYFVEKIFRGRTILLTAGPTQEFIDPVRFLSNASSGKMGYALAGVAQAMGAEVILVSGPVALSVPYGVRCFPVISAEEMHKVTLGLAESADVFIATAAVADYRPVNCKAQKIKKAENSFLLDLVLNRDILADVARLEKKPFLCGFAAETQNPVHYGRAKLEGKKLDLVCVNDVSQPWKVFGSDENEVVLISRRGEKKLARMSKAEVARHILLYIHREMQQAG